MSTAGSLALFFAAAVLCVAQTSETELLLNPKAIPPRAAPESPEQLRRNFANPPAEFRSMPLWVWNDEMNEARITEQLRQFQQQGIGGVFVHPRPGLMTSYLSDEWFRLWKFALAEGKRLGILVNIYDENSYPSGFAGGQVPSRAPDTAAQYVQVEESRTIQRRGVTVAFFAVAKDPATGAVTAAKKVEQPSQVPEGQTVMAFRLRRASGNPWTGEFPYVDLTNPRTTPMFLETTHEQYKKHVGDEFGKTVRWAFTDEPLIATAGAYDSAALSLPLSYNTLSEFQKRNGYDLADVIPSLFWDVGDFRKVRFDYWQTLHDLWKENFMRPMFQWCDRNNLQFTGHWMEHEWPYPWISPADASLYAYEHVPGIDMLEGSNLRKEGKDPHLLFTIRQMASVSHQLGRRAFCEAYGVAGWDSTFEHYKRFGDWLMVHGVNFMDQHLAFSTIRGARKRDHPQSFSDVSAWWPYYRLHADHLARVSYLSSVSESRNRVLVLQPTTSGFLYARRGGATPELARMKADNAAIHQFLSDHHVDYDLGDEYMIEWFGKQETAGKFRIGKAAYDVLVWPENMANLRKQTLPHLERYLASGGEVLALSDPAAYVDGRSSDAVSQMVAKYASQWKRVASHADLLAAIRKSAPPRIRFDRELPAGTASFDRVLPDGDRVLFFANTGLGSVSAKVEVDGAALELLDTVTGKVSPAAFTASGSKLNWMLSLAPAGSALYLLHAKPVVPPAPAAPVPLPGTTLTTSNWRIRADAPNVLPLDYCDVKIGDRTYTNINTWRANWTIWQSHGFERPAWDNAVQFNTSVFDRNHFDAKNSGFDATFRFDVASDAAKRGLELALESPELYRISVNGKPVDFRQAANWLDPHLRAIPIENLVRTGENFVTISAHPFDVRMELENVYLRGPAFAARPQSKGFRLEAGHAALEFGSWAKQGYPFYGDAVTYETDVDIPRDAKTVKVQLPEWQGSVAVVSVDGRESGRIGWQPFEAAVDVTPGKHTIAVKIVSTPRNPMGPFHNPTKPRMRAWPAAWAEFPETQPPGSAYDVLDYGLMSAPVLTVAGGSR